jgi:four helix bundle suffix protein
MRRVRHVDGAPMQTETEKGFIPPHGGYAGLLAYKKALIETRSPEVVTNIFICGIHQTNYLLDQLIPKLEQDFLAQGGLRERMTRARLAQRAKQKREFKP